MADIDPELRDKIIETHTLVKRMDKEHDEHKHIIDARFSNVKVTLEKHDIRIEKSEHFRTKVLTYAAVISAMGAFVIEGIILIAKKMGGV